MKYGLLSVLCAGLIMFPRIMTAKVTVLTEEPVAEFTLPDGSVVSNAYAFRRTSQGMMVIFDGGSYYLNFATLPDEWRAAYEVSDAVEQVTSVMTQGEDPYAIYEIISLIKGLPAQRAAFLKSTNYKGQLDEVLLATCALQCLLEDNFDESERIDKALRDHFPGTKFETLSSYIQTCPVCNGQKVRTFTCDRCDGTGVCSYCDGEGELESNFSEVPPLRCTNCRGTGECLTCKGSGKRYVACVRCQRRGTVVDEESVQKVLGSYVKRLGGAAVSEGENALGQTAGPVMSSGESAKMIREILPYLNSLPARRVEFLKSSNYKGTLDEELMAACSLQYLLEGDFDKAVLIEQELYEKFSATTFSTLSRLMETCPVCGGEKVRTFSCEKCNGTGTCLACDGEGELESNFLKTPAMPCTTCQGTGECLTCKGSGKRYVACSRCQRRGKVVNEEAAKKLQALYVKRLIDGE